MLYLHLGESRLHGKPLCRQFNPAGRPLRAENAGQLEIPEIQELTFEHTHQGNWATKSFVYRKSVSTNFKNTCSKLCFHKTYLIHKLYTLKYRTDLAQKIWAQTPEEHVTRSNINAPTIMKCYCNDNVFGLKFVIANLIGDIIQGMNQQII